ncbi:MAG: aminoacyl-tRNA hydrolase [Spirochaetota bacterium]
MRRLLVLLGNPGKKYHRTRHNAGRLFGDYLGEALGLSWRGKFHGLVAEAKLAGERVVLLEPETFMNDSGRSARAATDFYSIPLQSVMAVYDDTELDFGVVAVQTGGGFKGHNGVRSLAQHVGGGEFPRLRIGVGRPRSGALSAHVLGPFNSWEWSVLEDVFSGARRLVEEALGAWPPEEGRWSL